MGISDAHSRGRRTRRAEENALGTPNKRNRDSEGYRAEVRVSLKTNIATRPPGTDSALLAAPTMETKTCARCKTTLPKNQENFPHGSSWCTKCCPVSDSDSD